jgi:alkanesulfonate monooxygenase SsuD/methylene tetrahydromethanopterin reductase-like flavin-dependent oxidoreductase (luciferase family)
LAEAVRVIAGCFADQPFSHAGAYYTIQDLNLLPKPIQRPRPPILIGGGSRRILSIAARHADIVGITFRTTADGMPDFADIPAEATAHKVAWVRQAAGERFGDIELSVFAPLIAVTDDDPRQAADRLLQAFGFGLASQLSVEQVLASLQALIGSVEHIIEMLQARRQRYGLSYVVIREADVGSAASHMDALAPVVARLAGDPAPARAGGE